MFADLVKIKGIIGIDHVVYLNRNTIVKIISKEHEKRIYVYIANADTSNWQFSNIEDYNNVLALLITGKE